MNIILLANLAAAFLGVHNLEVAPPVSAKDHPIEQCAFERIQSAVGSSEYWHDLGPSARLDSDLAQELSDMMPGYRLAYLNRANMGLLLIGGSPLAGSMTEETHRSAYWLEAEMETRRACDASGVACEVRALEDAPYGLSAVTRIDAEDGVFRRETLAFPGGDGCSYSIQFSSPEPALSEPEWQAVRDGLMTLRNLVVPTRQATR
ncbi:MAG: hypothetical protein Tsb008_22770 [Rhodothalassiaceae bacterium]